MTFYYRRELKEDKTSMNREEEAKWKELSLPDCTSRPPEINTLKMADKKIYSA